MRYLQLVLTINFLYSSYVMSCGRGRQSPPPDISKPKIMCLPSIEKVADPFQIYTKVYWNERAIVANDNRDGAIKPFRSHGKGPGNTFSGTSKITYTAKDRGGNYASCSFSIVVKVRKCPDWGNIPDGWKICHTHDFRRGSRCRFGCYGGHELDGPSETTCLDSEEWDIATKPVCRRLKCDKLFPSPDQNGIVEISCTDSNHYRSKCTYHCADGYSILSGHSKVRVCSENRYWQGSIPRCVDTEPPMYINCPYTQYGYAERSQTTGRILWIDPSATDNSGSVTLTQIYGPKSGSELEVGEHVVRYIASDAVNNTAFCEFTVVMKQIKCHTIYPLPYTSVVCPNGRIFGSSCEFVCETGCKLNGSSQTLCDKTDTLVPYGKWTFMDNQPFCEMINKCPAVRPPDNGALACDTWLHGKFCQILCEENFILSSRKSGGNLLVCGDSGVWYGYTNTPHCEEVDDEHVFTFLTVGMEYNYYEGPCDETREDIKAKFLEVFTKGSGVACQPPQCVVDNVQIICGRRSEDKRTKRSGDHELTFIVKIVLSNDLNPTDKTIIRSSIKEGITTASLNGSLNLNMDEFLAESPSIQVSQIDGECSTGNAFYKKEMQCVKCNVGHFHDKENEICTLCARGFYQDQPQQSTCKQCPHGKTTKAAGAHSDLECEDACPPGFYSSTGTPLCSSCDIGFYTEHYGSLKCTKCKGSQITLTSGSSFESHCIEFDVEYNKLNESEVLAAASLDTQANSLEQFILTLFVKCSQCESILQLNDTENTELSITHSDGILFTYNGQRYTTEIDIVGSMMWTQITVVYSGLEFITYIDNKEIIREQISTRKRRSADIQVNMTVTIGGVGFIGSISQLNMWSNISIYIPEDTNTCYKNDQGDLINWRQFSELDGSFVLTKSRCDVDNNCERSSCYNGGSCIDSVGSFSCVCPLGFIGKYCEVNIDDCLDNACDNNATCIDGDDEYRCDCLEDFTGKYCEYQLVNGGWTEFEIISECSVTCGTGTQQMSRACENPRPLNGGQNCEGSTIMSVPCETNVVCVNDCETVPTTLINGSMNCDWIDNETRVCKPLCDEGFEFDSDLFVNSSGIVCGPETGYEWNIKNEDNPDAQIPSCEPKHMAPTLRLDQSGVYHNLTADVSNVAADIKSTIRNKLRTVGCLLNMTCEIEDVQVLSPKQPEVRKRRETLYVMFTIEMSCNNTIGQGNCYDLLAEIVTTFNTFVQNRSFTIHHDEVEYDVDVDSTSLDGLAECELGYASVWDFCVSCGKGTYATNYYCESCPRGYFQDEEAQTSCKKCPDGWTTSGLMTRDIIHCNVEKSEEDFPMIWIIVAVNTVAVTAVLVLIIAIVKCMKG